MGVLVLQLDGALSNGQEQRIRLGLTGAIDVTHISAAVRTAPSGGDLTYRVQSTSGASPTFFIQATVQNGQLVGLTVEGSIPNVTADLYLRVVTANGAANLTVTAQVAESVAGRSFMTWNIDGAPPVLAEWARIPGPAFALDLLAIGFIARVPPSPSNGLLTLRVLDSSDTILSSILINVFTSDGTGGFVFPPGSPPLRIPGGSTFAVIGSSSFTTGQDGALFVLELGTPAIGDNLCTVDDVRSILGIDTPDQDAEIQVAVTAASDMIRSYTGRRLTELANVVDERIDPQGQSLRQFALRDWPILGTTGINEEDGGALVPTANYRADKETGIIYALGGYTFDVPVLVDYALGFVNGIPQELRYAAMLQAAHLYQQSARAGGRLGNRGPAQAEAGSPGYVIGPWQPDARDIVDRYRRFRY